MSLKVTKILLIAALFSTLSGSAQAESTPAPQSKPPAANEQPKEDLKPVLAPEQFFGAAAMGYGAAKANPHDCSKLFCYCGCDITDKHTCLLDCFTSTHGVDCHICQEESMHALRLHRDGDSLSTIQKTIDETYSNRYPFKEESPALKKYKATRLWTSSKTQPAAAGAAHDHGGDDSCCSK